MLHALRTFSIGNCRLRIASETQSICSSWTHPGEIRGKPWIHIAFAELRRWVRDLRARTAVEVLDQYFVRQVGPIDPGLYSKRLFAGG